MHRADERKQGINGYEYQHDPLPAMSRYRGSQQIFTCLDPSPQRYLGE
jgi:hypothetical protein